MKDCYNLYCILLVLGILVYSCTAEGPHIIQVPNYEHSNSDYILPPATTCPKSFILIGKDVERVELSIGSYQLSSSMLSLYHNMTSSSSVLQIDFNAPETPGKGTLLVKAIDLLGASFNLDVPYVCQKLIPDIKEIGLVIEPISTSYPYLYEFKVLNNEMINIDLDIVANSVFVENWSSSKVEQFNRNTFFLKIYALYNSAPYSPKLEFLLANGYNSDTKPISIDIPFQRIASEVRSLTWSAPQTVSSPLFLTFQLSKNDTRDMLFYVKLNGVIMGFYSNAVYGNPFNSTFFISLYGVSSSNQIEIYSCQLNQCQSRASTTANISPIQIPTIDFISSGSDPVTRLPALDNGFFVQLVSANQKYTRGDYTQIFIVQWYSTPFRPTQLSSHYYLDDSTYGFKTGTYESYTRNALVLVSKHEKRIQSGFYFQSELEIIVDFSPPTISDDEPPIISSFELIPIPGNNQYIILRVKIVDDISGFSALLVDEFEDPFILTPANLVEGNPLGGTYEVFMDRGIFFYGDFRIADLASNLNVYGITQLTTEFGKMIPFSNPRNYVYDVLDFEITSASWSHNYVDVSSSSYTIIFRFSVANPNTEYAPLLKLGKDDYISSSVVYYEYLQEKEFYGKWNESSLQYEIPVKIPLRMFTGQLVYQIIYFQTSIFSSYLAKSFPNSVVDIYSEQGDMLGPIFENITRIPAQGVAQVSGSGAEIGWSFKVFDSLNGFKSGLVTVVGDRDQNEIIFEITPFSPGFIIEVNEYCISQTYTITSISLVDNGGYVSNMETALINFPDLDIRRINTTCQPIIDIEPPVLNSLTCIQQAIDVGSSNRMLNCTVSVTDLVSGIHMAKPPVLYLTSLHKIIKFKPVSTQFNLQNNIPALGRYEYQMPLPYGFGYPEYTVISIYGIMDNNCNFKGYSAQDLEALSSPNHQYSVDTTVFTFATATVIESTGKITTNGGDLLIIGKSFGLDNNSVVKIDYNDNNGYSQTFIPSFFSSTALIIKDIRPLLKPFKIQVHKDGEFISNEFIVIPDAPPVYPPSPSTSSSSLDSSTSSSSSSSSTQQTPTPTQPPNHCKNDCGGPSQGYCSSTGCICHSPWMGIDCKSKVIIIPTPSINNTIPSTNISIPSTSNNEEIALKGLISIVELQELDTNNVPIYRYPFTQWIWSNISTDNEPIKYLYSTNITNQLDQSITNVSVSIQYFDKQQNITFAGELLNMNQFSIKYSINITSYTFTNSLNQLQLIMKVSLESQQDQGCSALESGNTTVTNSEYVKLQVDDHSLYGRFIKRGIIDGRISTITNQLLPNYNNNNNGESNQFNNIHSFIGINFRSYRRLVQLDPDFSVLIDQRPAASDTENSICSSQKKKLSAGQLAGIIIGSVVFAAILIVSVSYCIYKKKNKRSSEKILNIN
ncbi:hypothetical protein CYY_007957 [Polysphondylium violaceum]|uniref:EGF-like domain-containing protein n=1 Tax=Polysphondylium violaceum TaxID=133409 RepID=A0A8J4V1S0_9MYCE|nr:hypothetical protein CYY_007957 [Polysphondylium violaceum]